MNFSMYYVLTNNTELAEVIIQRLILTQWEMSVRMIYIYMVIIANLPIMKGTHYLLNNTSGIDSGLCFKPTTGVPSVYTLATMTQSGGRIILNTAFKLNSIMCPCQYLIWKFLVLLRCTYNMKANITALDIANFKFFVYSGVNIIFMNLKYILLKLLWNIYISYYTLICLLCFIGTAKIKGGKIT